MVLRHNLFQQTKTSEFFNLIVKQIIFFNNQGDSEQIGILGPQMGERQLTMKAYEGTAREPFGHLMIGLDVRSKKKH